MANRVPNFSVICDFVCGRKSMAHTEPPIRMLQREDKWEGGQLVLTSALLRRIATRASKSGFFFFFFWSAWVGNKVISKKNENDCHLSLLVYTFTPSNSDLQRYLQRYFKKNALTVSYNTHCIYGSFLQFFFTFACALDHRWFEKGAIISRVRSKKKKN